MVCIVAIGAWFASVRVIERGALSHPDEGIALGVLEHLRAHPSLDTNWRHADVPEVFRASQYNFSAYYLALYSASRLVAAATGEAHVPFAARIASLRKFSSWCFAASVVLAGAIGLRFGPWAAVAASLAVALSPSLLMDSFFVRPEAFSTLLALALAAVFIAPIRKAWLQLALMGLLLGVLMATKVSFAWYALLPLFRLVGLARRDGQWVAHMLVVSVSAVLGFIAGAPGAVAHYGEFIAGVRFLSLHYNSEHWPHGLGSSAPLPERVAYGARWLWQTHGLVLFAALVGVLLLIRRREWIVVSAVIPFALTLGYFLAAPVFFERNLSPAVAILGVLAGIAIGSVARLRLRNGSRMVASFLLGVVLIRPALVSSRLVDTALPPDELAEERARIAAHHRLAVKVIGWSPPFPAQTEFLAAHCGDELLEVYHSGDHRHDAAFADLRARGWEIVASRASAFDGIVTSTFHTYFSPPVAWLKARDGGAACPRLTDTAIPGGAIPVDVDHDSGWARAAVYPSVAAPPAGEVYGSWTTGDAAKGRLRMGPFTSCNAFVVPVVTGPDPRRQSLVIRWRIEGEGSARAKSLSLAGADHRWRYVWVPEIAPCRVVELEAIDAGGGWGEWMGLASPSIAAPQ